MCTVLKILYSQSRLNDLKLIASDPCIQNNYSRHTKRKYTPVNK